MATSDMALKSLMCGVSSYCIAEFSGRKGVADSITSRGMGLEHDGDGGDGPVEADARISIGGAPQGEI